MTRAKDISKIITDANLSGTLDVTGAFTSQGIDDNATSTAITVDASQNVGIGITGPTVKLDIVDDGVQLRLANSTTGTTTSDGSRIQLSGNDLLLVNRESANMQFYTADTERMRIDSSGNVGIGTSSNYTDAKLHVYGVNGGGDVSLRIQNSTTTDNSTSSLKFTNTTSDYAHGTITAGRTPSSYLSFSTSNNTEAMRINNNGSVLVGKTAVSDSTNGIQLRVLSDGTILGSTRTSGEACMLNRNGSSGTLAQFKFQGSNCGTISVNTNSTAYNTSSDHRLKENVTADWDATTRLKQLNPVRFNFIADADTTVDGFLAHEVQSVVPEAISGTHNEVDADGNPVYQGIDQSKLVPLLVKTIQELEARITALENGE